ncbi:MMUT [Symbiodinium microadriaticum]|nr:MMUT [Symbiodinium microadriaticum]
MAKMRIEESATRKQARIDSKEETVVGVNKYRVENESPIDVLSIDNAAVRASQTAKLQKLRAERNNAEVEAALAKLTEAAKMSGGTCAGDHDSNLLKLAVEAARVRCTLGEITSALESEWGRHVAYTRVVQGAYSATFNEAGATDEYDTVLKAVEAFAVKEGRRPRLLVAKMGQDGHDRGAKVIASGFSDMGYDVDVGPLFSTPEEVARQAVDADAHVIGVSSQAAGHRTLVPALVQALEAAAVKVLGMIGTQ